VEPPRLGPRDFPRAVPASSLTCLDIRSTSKIVMKTSAKADGVRFGPA
jgi:hypothetical protein